MALFGLSPLFLSLIASTFFSSEEEGLDVTRFTTFMAILAGIVHIIGALNLRTPALAKVEIVSQDESSEDEENTPYPDSERTPLIAPKNRRNVQVTVIPVEHDQTVLDLLKDPHFWLLALIVLVGLGSVSMLEHTFLNIILISRSAVRNGHKQHRNNCNFTAFVVVNFLLLVTIDTLVLLYVGFYSYSSSTPFLVEYLLSSLGRTNCRLRLACRFLPS